METTSRHITRFDEYLQQVASFIEAMKPYGFLQQYAGKEDPHHAIVAGWDCFVWFYPDKEVCTMQCLKGAAEQTFRFETPLQLIKALSSLSTNKTTELCHA